MFSPQKHRSAADQGHVSSGVHGMLSVSQLTSLRQRVFNGVAWSTAGNVGRQMITFGISAALARILGPEAFGLVAIAMLYLAFVQIFVNQGFGTALLQRGDLEPEHLDAAFWASVLGASVLCLMTIGFAETLAGALDDPRVAPVLRWLGLMLVLAALSTVPTAILTRSLAFKRLSLRTLASGLVGGLVGLTMAILGFGVWSLMAQQLITALVGTLTVWWAVQWRPAFRISGRHLRELYWVSLNMLETKGYGFSRAGQTRHWWPFTSERWFWAHMRSPLV